MKLFHKIFLCFVVIFSITFQTAGYLLINYTYENAVEQQKKTAFQDFKYNSYILQSILYSDPKFIYEGDTRSILNNFTVPVFIYNALGTDSNSLISNICLRPFFTVNASKYSWVSVQFCEEETENVIFQYDLLYNEGEDHLSYQILEKEGRSCIMVFGIIKNWGNEICFITQTDISSVINRQKSMIAYFQKLYLVFICISYPVIFLLTQALTASLKKVSKAVVRIAQGNYSQRIQLKGRDEIYELPMS